VDPGSADLRRGPLADHDDDVQAVATMCQTLKVSRSGFYDWARAEPSAQAVRRAKISKHVKAALHEGSRLRTGDQGALGCVAAVREGFGDGPKSSPASLSCAAPSTLTPSAMIHCSASPTRPSAART
jgi:hypothetical protein